MDTYNADGRSLSLCVSAIPSYLKYLGRLEVKEREKKVPSEYIGEVGQR